MISFLVIEPHLLTHRSPERDMDREGVSRVDETIYGLRGRGGELSKTRPSADQLVYYHSRSAQESRVDARKLVRTRPQGDVKDGDTTTTDLDPDPRFACRCGGRGENESLRQIGLAQGMSILRELFGWSSRGCDRHGEGADCVVRARERGSGHGKKRRGEERSNRSPHLNIPLARSGPPNLLIQQLRQAHCIFTLHHGPSLTGALRTPLTRQVLSYPRAFWTHFLRTWDVLLHGNPAADVFGGIKLASGGELGIGVGEEEWGSGEREVLEHLTGRTDGLVDLVVSRFGDAAPIKDKAQADLEDESVPWSGSGKPPLASDGVIFGGVGKITRSSLLDVSQWSRQIYTLGEHAYGVPR
ncbi:hypothetical protein MRB53_038133 [Persea americana]|nr:hypothetical protein MRB53_038133 [Persea americana]